MATKLDKVVTYHEKLLPTKSHDPLIMGYYEISWQFETSNTTVRMVNKIGRMLTYLEGAVINHITLWSRGNVTNENSFISTTRAPIATRIVWVINYRERLLSIRSPNHLNAWSCYITLQTKNVPLLPQYPWPPNLASGEWYIMKHPHS